MSPRNTTYPPAQGSGGGWGAFVTSSAADLWTKYVLQFRTVYTLFHHHHFFVYDFLFFLLFLSCLDSLPSLLPSHLTFCISTSPSVFHITFPFFLFCYFYFFLSHLFSHPFFSFPHFFLFLHHSLTPISPPLTPTLSPPLYAELQQQHLTLSRISPSPSPKRKHR